MASEKVSDTPKLSDEDAIERHASVVATEKTTWERLWPVIACGAGLFSDGYLNGVIGSVSTMLSAVYPDEYKNSSALSNVSSIVFAGQLWLRNLVSCLYFTADPQIGTVLGQLVFGFTSDMYSRKWSLFVSTIILIVFAALGAGSYGAGGSIQGMFAALTAYRFFLGIGIGKS